MKHLRRSEGSALILVIGVIAALAILAASVVILVGNVQSNTSRDRAQTKSFTVAEGGVDLVLEALADTFPKASTTTLTVDTTGFLDALDASQYADTSIDWAIHDDSGVDAAGDPDYSVGAETYDKNNNNRVWVEVTGSANGRSTRVRVLAEMVLVNLGLLDNIAIWTPGEFNNQSAASTVSYEVLGPGATLATIQYNYLDPGSRVTDTSLVQEVSPALPADQIITPELISYFRGLAKTKMQAGVAKHYTDVSQVPSGFDPNNQTPWEGVIYVDSGADPTQLAATQNITWSKPWTLNGDGVGGAKQPGVLMVDAKLLKIQGNNTQYYGLIYCTGAVEIVGGATIHGIVLAGGQGLSPGDDAVKLSGTQTVIYNDNVRANLNREFSVSVRMVPDTWRELRPTD